MGNDDPNDSIDGRLVEQIQPAESSEDSLEYGHINSDQSVDDDCQDAESPEYTGLGRGVAGTAIREYHDINEEDAESSSGCSNSYKDINTADDSDGDRTEDNSEDITNNLNYNSEDQEYASEDNSDDTTNNLDYNSEYQEEYSSDSEGESNIEEGYPVLNKRGYHYSSQNHPWLNIRHRSNKRRRETCEERDIPKSQQSHDTKSVLDNCATVVRCRILQNELNILRAEKNDWIEREQELLQRIENARDEIKRQRKSVIDSQSKALVLEQEIELISCRSKLRQESLERSYRTLCDNVKLADEASLKARLDIRRLQTRNLILEELVQTKAMVNEELDVKLAQLKADDEALSMAAETKDITTVSGDPGIQDADDTLGSRNDVNVGEQNVPDQPQKQMDKCNDTQHQHRTGGDPLPESLREVTQLMTSHLQQMIACSKETEKHMREAVDAQLGEFRDMLQQTRSDLCYKTEECNVLSRSLETLRAELDLTKNNLSQNIETNASVNGKYQEKVLQYDALQKEIESLTAQLGELKRELESSMSRERKNKIAFDDYVKDTDAKLYKMELMCSSKGIDTSKLETDETRDSVVHPAKYAEVSNGVGDQPANVTTPTTVGSGVEASRDNGPAEPVAASPAKDQLVDHKVSQDTNVLSPAASGGTTPAPADVSKMQEVFKDTIVKLLKKSDMLTEKLKEQVVRAYNYEQQVNKLQAKLDKGLCGCRKALEHVKATKRKRCWCRYKRVQELRKRVAHASLKLDAETIKAVIKDDTSGKRRKLDGKKQTRS
ncbi:hypothetical protein BaOVIS_018760 [Babesia ovis]|uniref:Uncharacterized protein n=1 Tax=Babesia ovis TaxID=5869 RepID=A0A9W5TAI4_BABOV|nr:hypothetical protein BaOVIS_018760 [Babesia ovis]